MTTIRNSNLLLLSMSILLTACTAEFVSPFSVDPAMGNFSLSGEDFPGASYRVEINKLGALEEAHIFRGSDSLVAIGSCDGLDLIMVFKEIKERPVLQISVINPGDSALEISSLEVFSVATGDSDQRHSGCLLRAMEDPLWLWMIEEDGAAVLASLNLSGSCLILLPEERVVLPPLHFFSHLCSE